MDDVWQADTKSSALIIGPSNTWIWHNVCQNVEHVNTHVSFVPTFKTEKFQETFSVWRSVYSRHSNHVPGECSLHCANLVASCHICWAPHKNTESNGSAAISTCHQQYRELWTSMEAPLLSVFMCGRFTEPRMIMMEERSCVVYQHPEVM